MSWTAPTPILPFGPSEEERFELRPEVLEGLVNALSKELRTLVSQYLRSGTMVLALMGHTTDVIGAAFGVSGGFSVMTDGAYYWRLDSAEYVMEYGIGLDSRILEWMESNNWTPRPVNRTELLRIDAYLSGLLRFH